MYYSAVFFLDSFSILMKPEGGVTNLLLLIHTVETILINMIIISSRSEKKSFQDKMWNGDLSQSKLDGRACNEKYKLASLEKDRPLQTGF